VDNLGYIKVNTLMKPVRVFCKREAADPHSRQVVTSAGMGAAAAIQATRYLEAQEASPGSALKHIGDFAIGMAESPFLSC
jgi:hypothetical protein